MWQENLWMNRSELLQFKSSTRIHCSAAEPGIKRSRRLILLRHADSSWSNPTLKDHERTLSGRGRQQAASIASQLDELGWIPQLVLCSDATRTKQTLSIMKKHWLELLRAPVHFLPSFYSVSVMDGHTAQHLQTEVCKHSTNEINTVLCMGHNKGWEEAAGAFCGESVELKTANAALLESSGASWEETFDSGEWELKQIVQPAEVAESSRLDFDFLT